jgi:hypothetical protein
LLVFLKCLGRDQFAIPVNKLLHLADAGQHLEHRLAQLAGFVRRNGGKG